MGTVVAIFLDARRQLSQVRRQKSVVEKPGKSEPQVAADFVVQTVSIALRQPSAGREINAHSEHRRGRVPALDSEANGCLVKCRSNVGRHVFGWGDGGLVFDIDEPLNHEEVV